MIRDNLLWKNPSSRKLLILFPGGSGTQRNTTPGYPACASHFWLQGYNSYIMETSGQDGHPGVFSPLRSLRESQATLNALLDLFNPEDVFLLGSCGGGTIATALAAEFREVIKGLLLFETLAYYDKEARSGFYNKALGYGMNISEDFLIENADTALYAGGVECPVAIFRGECSNCYNDDESRKLQSLFSNARNICIRVFADADHNTLRGRDLGSLRALIQGAEQFFSTQCI